MRTAIVPLRRRSICPCGYGVLDDAIQIGTRYRIYPDEVVHDGRYRCGRCGAWQDGITLVKANSVLYPGNPPCWIPAGLFVSAGPKVTA